MTADAAEQSLTYFTANCAPAVARPPITTWPPCWLTQPM